MRKTRKLERTILDKIDWSQRDSSIPSCNWSLSLASLFCVSIDPIAGNHSQNRPGHHPCSRNSKIQLPGFAHQISRLTCVIEHFGGLCSDYRRDIQSTFNATVLCTNWLRDHWELTKSVKIWVEHVHDLLKPRFWASEIEKQVILARTTYPQDTSILFDFATVLCTS